MYSRSPPFFFSFSSRSRQLTSGTVGNTYQFDAFGMSIASAGTIANSYLYSGERFDSNLNLYHLRARYYNMLTGRFETMDPVLGRIFNPGTLHKYVYARNNPVNRIDPTGRVDIVEEVSLLKQVVALGTVGLLLVGELHELVECAAEALAGFGSGEEPAFPVVQRSTPPDVGPVPGDCRINPHDEWPGNEGNPLGPPRTPESFE